MIGRLLGIDHGLKRIGLAVSDALGISAREHSIIVRGTVEDDFEQIKTILLQERISAIVIGIPHDDSESEYSQADKVRNWAERLQTIHTLPQIYWDESLTSQEATVLAKRLKRKVTDPIDDLAARLLLQSYLNALSEGMAPKPE